MATKVKTVFLIAILGVLCMVQANTTQQLGQEISDKLAQIKDSQGKWSNWSEKAVRDCGSGVVTDCSAEEKEIEGLKADVAGKEKQIDQLVVVLAVKEKLIEELNITIANLTALIKELREQL